MTLDSRRSAVCPTRPIRVFVPLIRQPSAATFSRKGRRKTTTDSTRSAPPRHSDDPQRRFAQHQSGKGARFFHTSPAQALAYVEACAGKGDALRRERAIKRLSKAAKEVLILSVDGASSAVGGVRD